MKTVTLPINDKIRNYLMRHTIHVMLRINIFLILLKECVSVNIEGVVACSYYSHRNNTKGKVCNHDKQNSDINLISSH